MVWCRCSGLGVRRRCSPALGALSPLACPPWECRCLSPTSRPRGRRRVPWAPTVTRSLDRGAAATTPPNLGTAATTPDRGTVAVVRPSLGATATRPGWGAAAARSLASATVARVWLGAVARASGWAVKKWALALWSLFYRCPDLVRQWKCRFPLAPSTIGTEKRQYK
jgi:hypothetical protein